LLLVGRNYLWTQSNWHGKNPTVGRESAVQIAENPEVATSTSSCEPSVKLTTSADTTEEFQTLLRQVRQSLSEAEVREWLATDEYDPRVQQTLK